MIGPHCKKGEVNKAGEEKGCVSGLKAGLCVNTSSASADCSVFQKKGLAVAFCMRPFLMVFLSPPLPPCI